MIKANAWALAFNFAKVLFSIFALIVYALEKSSDGLS